MWSLPAQQASISHAINQKYMNKKRGNLITEIPSICGALVGIRTPNLLIRSEMLYPVELQVHFRFVNGLQK